MRSVLRWGGLACALALAACADKPPVYVERPVEDLYNTAMDQLLEGGNQAAAKSFDEVDRQHPYSVWATKAQLMSAYALYQGGKYDDSVIAADRFIQLHPGQNQAGLIIAAFLLQRVLIRFPLYFRLLRRVRVFLAQKTDVVVDLDDSAVLRQSGQHLVGHISLRIAQRAA